MSQKDIDEIRSWLPRVEGQGHDKGPKSCFSAITPDRIDMERSN